MKYITEEGHKLAKEEKKLFNDYKIANQKVQDEYERYHKGEISYDDAKRQDDIAVEQYFRGDYLESIYFEKHFLIFGDILKNKYTLPIADFFNTEEIKTLIDSIKLP